jgi:DNA end-binding protein Ku
MKRKTTTKSKKPREKSDDGEEPRRSRDIWRGAISFGLVEIPVALVSAEEPTGLSLSYLDRRDFSPVGYRRYNKQSGAEVPWSEIVHGYEYEKGEYVVLGKNDLARANPALTQTISIEQFVDASEIEPIYFEKPYYLEPLKPHSKAYALLRDTLQRTSRVGVARVAIRTKEHVAVVGVRERALVLYLLRFAEEVRPPTALRNLEPQGRGSLVSPKELEMAERLVADMTGEWNPDAYKDDYVHDVMKVVEEKIRSGETHALDTTAEPAPRKSRGEIIDLMPLLRKSVEAARGSTPRPKSTSKARSAHRPAARRRSA